MNGAGQSGVSGMVPPGQGGGVAGMAPPGQGTGFGSGGMWGTGVQPGIQSGPQSVYGPGQQRPMPMLQQGQPWQPNTMAPTFTGSSGVQQQGLGVFGGGAPSNSAWGQQQGGDQPPMPPGLGSAPGLLGPAGQQQDVLDMLRRKGLRP